MHRIPLLFLLFTLTLPAAADTVRLKDAAAVTIPITLGQVAHLEGDLALALADLLVAPDAADTLTLAAVRDALTRHGVNWARLSLKGPPRCELSAAPPEVTRDPADGAPAPSPTFAVTTDDPNPALADLPIPMSVDEPLTVRDAVARRLEALNNVKADALVVDFRKVDEAVLNLSTLAAAVTVEPVGEATLGNLPLRITRRVGHTAPETFTVVARVQQRITAVVATRPIARGQRFGVGDVELREVLTDRPDRAWLDQPAAIVGATARGNLDAGEPVEPQMVATPLVVRRGQIVTLAVRSGNVAIEAVGLAEQDGAVGDVVRVRRGKERQGPLLLGTVVADGRVELVTGRGDETLAASQ